MAAELGATARTIRRWLSQLVRAGAVITRQRQRTSMLYQVFANTFCNAKQAQHVTAENVHSKASVETVCETFPNATSNYLQLELFTAENVRPSVRAEMSAQTPENVRLSVLSRPSAPCMNRELELRTERTGGRAAAIAEVRIALAGYLGTTLVKGSAAEPRMIDRIAVILGQPEALPRFKAQCERFYRQTKPESWGIFVTLAERAAQVPASESDTGETGVGSTVAAVIDWANSQGIPVETGTQLWDAMELYRMRRKPAANEKQRGQWGRGEAQHA